MADIHWYPGHMTKAIRQMREDIKLIDVVIELVDARIPISSRNPDIDELAKNKSRVIILNKTDMADETVSEEWLRFFDEKGFLALKLNSKTGNGMKDMKAKINEAAKEKMERDRKRGILNRPVRAIVVGIPNVGKSTFINSFAGRAVTKTGNKPGVTKGKQWIRLNKSVELLDTPGILWPKFEDRKIAEHLAYIGSMRDEVVEKTELSLSLIRDLLKNYKGALESSYGLILEKEEEDYSEEFCAEVLKGIAEKRAFLKKGGEVDLDKAAFTVLDDFKNGRLGKISLERVGDLGYGKEGLRD